MAIQILIHQQHYGPGHSIVYYIQVKDDTWQSKSSSTSNTTDRDKVTRGSPTTRVHPASTWAKHSFSSPEQTTSYAE
ncbi:hypothetical protein B0H19DRAFT_1132419 [Mycena capillaripes]|nr:hypothetical protein B0H19DRAFT_1132419 [Mycena capillaripes]